VGLILKHVIGCKHRALHMGYKEFLSDHESVGGWQQKDANRGNMRIGGG
jgi:hypothetical protein